MHFKLKVSHSKGQCKSCQVSHSRGQWKLCQDIKFKSTSCLFRSYPCKTKKGCTHGGSWTLNEWFFKIIYWQ